MIDFRYHLVSIVAVFLALAIGIVLGATELQGSVIDGLRSESNALKNELSAANADSSRYEQAVGASDQFLQTAEPKLTSGMLTGDRIVFVTEPGAPSAVIDGIEKAAGAGYAGATITGTIALEPKFNDLSGTTRSSLSAINANLAATDSIGLVPAADEQTVYQQNAAQLIGDAILDQPVGQAVVTVPEAQAILKSYVQGGYLTISSGVPTDGANLAVIVTPQATTADGPNDPADQILLAIAAQFANASAATLVAGPSSAPPSAISVLRGSSVSGQVSSVDNADTTLGQISTIWALANQVAGEKPNSYGVSGASAVSPVPLLPVPSVTPTASATPTSKATGKVKKRP